MNRCHHHDAGRLYAVIFDVPLDCVEVSSTTRHLAVDLARDVAQLLYHPVEYAAAARVGRAGGRVVISVDVIGFVACVGVHRVAFGVQPLEHLKVAVGCNRFGHKAAGDSLARVLEAEHLKGNAHRLPADAAISRNGL